MERELKEANPKPKPAIQSSLNGRNRDHLQPWGQDAANALWFPLRNPRGQDVVRATMVTVATTAIVLISSRIILRSATRDAYVRGLVSFRTVRVWWGAGMNITWLSCTHCLYCGSKLVWKLLGLNYGMIRLPETSFNVSKSDVCV